MSPFVTHIDQEAGTLRYLLEDGINSQAFRHMYMPARVTNIEDDAEVGVGMTRAGAVRDNGRILAVSEPTPDETLQNPLPLPLSTIKSSSTAPYMGRSTSGEWIRSGRASTSRGGGWAEIRRERIVITKDLIRAMLEFDEEDAAGEVCRELGGMDELERAEDGEEEEDEVGISSSVRRRNHFIDDHCRVSKSGREDD